MSQVAKWPRARHACISFDREETDVTVTYWTSGIEKLRDTRERFGTGAALQYGLERLVNLVVFVEWLHIIVLSRDSVQPLDPEATARFSSRLATLADLEAMQTDPRLDVGPSKFEFFRRGDSCLLSYVDGELAGYAWAHTLGRPELIPGLTISVPVQFLYNYAAVTLPEFRGLGLQAYRHLALLDHGPWQGKRGLLGFVRHTNFASRRGQTKSGYRTLGSIWLIGGRRHYAALFSSSLRRSGIRRLE